MEDRVPRIKELKDIHTATHPAAKLERKDHGRDGDGEPEVDPADVLSALDEEADEDGDGE